MCDFCANEITTCQANPILSKSLNLSSGTLEPENAIIACDKYKSPVDVLKKQFH